MAADDVRRFSYSTRLIFLTVTLAAIGLALWSNSTLTFQSDISHWQNTPQWKWVPHNLVGKRVHFLRKEEPGPLATNVKILSAELSDLTKAKITVRIKPWQRWKIVRSATQVEWSCSPYGAAGLQLRQ